MGRSIKSTVTGEDVNYTTDEYKRQQFENQPEDNYPEIDPRLTPTGNVVRPAGQTPVTVDPTGFSRYASDKSIWDEGFAGDSQEALNAYRAGNQSTAIKALYTVGGGIISGLGTAIEDVGYLMDYATYANMVTDMDFSTGDSMNLYRKIVGGISGVGRDIKESTERDIMPVYEEQGDGSYSDQFFRWGSLKSVLDSAVGFGLTGLGAGSAVKYGTKAITKGITKWGKKAMMRSLATGSTVGNLATKAARTDAYLRLIGTKMPELFPRMGAAVTGIMTKGAEARMEGFQAYENYLRTYQPMVDQNIINQDQLEEQASNAANDVFDMTMATVLGDMLMVKGMFRGKQIVNKQLSKPTRWNRNKGLLLGAPKEGAEEMWQEAALKEGDYQTFQALKSQVSDELQQNKIKKLGFEADAYPERWGERFSGFLSSTEALVAGTIGLISGPMQAKAMSLPGRKQDIKNQYEAYDAQQGRYKENELLFGAQHKFKETMKQVATGQEMRKISQLIGDEGLSDFTEDAALLSVTHANLMDGTTEHLKEVLQEEGSPESISKLAKIEELEKDFKASKRFVNSDEMFNLGQNIKLSKDVIEHLKTRAYDTEKDGKISKSYNEAASKQEAALVEMMYNYNTMSTHEYQMKLAEQEVYAEELVSTQKSIAKNSSISALQNLKTQYPELTEDIDDRIVYLRNVDGTGKRNHSKAKKVNTTANNKDTSPDNTTTEGKIETIANKEKNNIALTSTEAAIKKHNENRVKEEVVKTTTESTDKIKDTEGNKYSKNTKTYIANRNKIKEGYTPIIKEVFSEESDLTGGPQISVTDSMLDEVTDAFLQAYNKAKSTPQAQKAMQDKIREVYNRVANSEQVEGEVTSSEKPGDSTHDLSTTDSQNIVAKAGNDLLDDLSKLDEKEPPTTNNAAEEDLIDHSVKLKKLDIARKSFENFIAALASNDIDPNGDFKLFISELEKATNNTEAIQENFTRLKGLFSAFYNVDIAETDYHELMGITEQDPSVDPLENSPEKIKEIEGIVLKYVSVTEDYTELMEIFTNEDIEDVGAKNETPAMSVAHLTKNYAYKYIDKNKVTKKDIDNKVNSNPIINPYRYNAGTPIKLELHEYDGDVNLGTGVKLPWDTLLQEYNSGNWEQFKQDNKLDPEATIYDYWPIKITGTETGEIVGHVHQTNWISKLSTPGAIQEKQKATLHTFREQLVKQLQTTNQPFDTSIIEKRIERSVKTGRYSGFALNTGRKPINTATAMPDNLSLGIKVLSDLEIPGKKTVKNNILNIDEVAQYRSGTPFITVPLGEKKGKMVYHTSPLVGQRVTPTQSKAITQAISIFITGNPEVNIGLYNAYKQEGLDLLVNKDLTTVLKKAIVLYNPAKAPMQSMINARLDKDKVGFLEFTNNTIKFGKSTVKEFTKGDQLSEKDLRILETAVLPYMYVNVNKDLLNKQEKFKFVEVNPETNELIPYEGDYNTFVKQNTLTYMRSKELDDGSFSSTIQNITTFDMQDLDKTKVERTEVEEVVTTEPVTKVVDYSSDPKVTKLASHFNKSVEAFMEPVLSGKITYDKYIKTQETVYKVSKNSKKYCG